MIEREKERKRERECVCVSVCVRCMIKAINKSAYESSGATTGRKRNVGDGGLRFGHGTTGDDRVGLESETSKCKETWVKLLRAWEKGTLVERGRRVAGS